MGPLSEGYEIPSVRFPFCLFCHFSGNNSQEFSDFLHEVRVPSNLKSDGAQFFEKGLYWDFCAKRAQDGPGAKVSTWNFSDFFAWSNSRFFLGIILFWSFWVKERAQNEASQVLSREVNPWKFSHILPEVASHTT